MLISGKNIKYFMLFKIVVDKQCEKRIGRYEKKALS